MKDKKYNPFSRALNNQKGVSAILVAILLPVLIGFAALAIDVGYMYTTRNELQNIADAAALAGASVLGKIYIDDVPVSTHDTHTLTSVQIGQIRTAVKDVATLNKRNDEPDFIIITEENTDNLSIGVWDWNAKVLNPTNVSPDAVQVTARRNTLFNGRVTTFFANILSIFGGSFEKFESSAIATAALSGPSIIAEGVANAPFAISENNPCDGPIIFSPTPDSCAGWHNYFDHNANSNAITSKMYGHIAYHDEGLAWLSAHAGSQAPDTVFTPPEMNLGDMLTLSGQQGANYFGGFFYTDWDTSNQPDPTTYVQDGNPHAYAPLVALFDFFRFRDGDDDGQGTQLDVCGTFYDPDDVWSTVVPMYKDTTIDGCSNPNGDMEIINFAFVQVVAVQKNPLLLQVCMNCDKVVEPGRGGGGSSAGLIKGAIPNLVQ